MKALTILITFLSFLSLSAQEADNSNSLQASLNKALAKEKSHIEDFQANIDPSKKVVQLKWSSSSLNKADQFIIEKSNDKVTWQEVATIYGAEHKDQEMEYLHLDYAPLNNLSYYRLKQKDKDGSIQISNIVPVNYVAIDGNMAGTNLFPVLTSDKIVVNIAFEEIFDKEILLVIRDKNGKEFYSKVIINIEDEALVAVPIENEVPKGDYLITATSENQIYSQNIVIK